MSLEADARSLLKVAYNHMDSGRSLLMLENFWREVHHRQLPVHSKFDAKRNNSGQLLKIIEKEARVESLESLSEAMKNYPDKNVFDPYLRGLAAEGRLPVQVEMIRRAKTSDMRTVIAGMLPRQTR